MSTETTSPVVTPNVPPAKTARERANDYLASMRSSSTSFFSSLDKWGWTTFILTLTLIITAIVNMSIAMNIDTEFIDDENEKSKAEHMKTLSWVILLMVLVIASFVIFVHLPKPKAVQA